MSKNRLMLHSAAILAIVFFAFLAIGSGASTPTPVATPVDEAPPPPRAPVVEHNSEKVISSKTSSKGQVDKVPDPLQKPYDALGLVFATSVTKSDDNGNPLDVQEGIITLLLREAQKLGGNDILNLRTDENTTRTQIVSGGSTKYITTITVTGSALAIKYRN